MLFLTVGESADEPHGLLKMTERLLLEAKLYTLGPVLVWQIYII